MGLLAFHSGQGRSSIPPRAAANSDEVIRSRPPMTSQISARSNRWRDEFPAVNVFSEPYRAKMRKKWGI